MFRFPRSLRIGLLTCGLLAATVAVAHAQAAAPSSPQNPRALDGAFLGAPVSLGPLWLVHKGDDPQWAQPDFDDSHWQVLDATQSLAKQNLTNVDSLWFRAHVSIPPGTRDLGLIVRSFFGSEQIFANGQLILSEGSFPPGGDLKISEVQYASIPDSAIIGHNTLTIAFRARFGRLLQVSPSLRGMNDNSQVLLGPAPLLSQLSTLYLFQNFTSNTTNFTMASLLLLIALALAVANRSDHEYWALAIMLIASLVLQGETIWQWLAAPDLNPGIFVFNAFFGLIVSIALIEFVRIVLGLPRSRAFVTYYWILGVFQLSAGPAAYYSSFLTGFGKDVFLLAILGNIVALPVSAGLPFLALWAWRRSRNRDALLLSIPLLIDASVRYWTFAVDVFYHLHWISFDQIPLVPVHGFYMQWSEAAQFLFHVALLVFLVLRTINIARYRARAASEMQAVRTLQGLLLARSDQPTPGYAVDTVYRPASEVGGDFFLVSPGADGSIVAIVGDVSGKGLLAAMRVSLILGALNRESSRTPAEVLSRLNHVLLGQGDMGFTTACCVRVEANGDYSFANAGHLNPYIEGEEIEAPGVLPLGLKGEATYSTVTGNLKPGQRLVLLSDGVPEARTKHELLGFDKLLELTRLGAAEIADAAQTFGQEDDITVLALARA